MAIQSYQCNTCIATFDDETGIFNVRGDGSTYSGYFGNYGSMDTTTDIRPYASIIPYIKKIVFEDSVKTIGPNAFIDYKNTTASYKDNFNQFNLLESIEFSNTPLTIKEFAFYGLILEDRLTIDATELSSHIKKVENFSFRHCTGIRGTYIIDSADKIAYSAFEGCGITGIDCSINLGELTTDSSYYYCFKNCKISGEFVIPETWTGIPTGMFQGNQITSVKFPDNITLNLHKGKTFGENPIENIKITSPSVKLNYDNNADSIFYNCIINDFQSCLFDSDNNLINTEIPDYFFANVQLKETSITIPEGITRIGKSSFLGGFTTSNFENVLFPQSLTYIGDNAFVGTKLTHIEFPSALEYIGKSAFSGCTSLTGDLTIPDSVIATTGLIRDDNFPFTGCNFNGTIVIGEKYDDIYIGNCTGFRNASLFINRVKETSFVESTSSSAYKGFFIRRPWGASSVYYDYTSQAKNILNCPVYGSGIFLYMVRTMNEAKGNISGIYRGLDSYYPLECMCGNVKVNYSHNIEDNTCKLTFDCNEEENLVDYNSKEECPWNTKHPFINTIEVKGTVKSLPNYTIANDYPNPYDSHESTVPTLNNKFTEINIINPSQIESLKNNCFANLCALTSINLPNVKNIGNEAFINNLKLNIDLSKMNVQIIGNNAFENCALLDIDNLSKAKITSIGNEAFKGTKLTNLEFPDTLVSIGDNAFADITTLTNTELKIPASVTNIGSNFVTCDTVYNVMNMSKANQTVASDAFAGLTQEGLLLYGYTENEGYKTVAGDKWRDLSNVAIMAPIMIDGMVVYPPTKDKCVKMYDNKTLEETIKSLITRIEALEAK